MFVPLLFIYFLHYFSYFFPTASNNRVLPWTLDDAGKHSLLSLRTQQAHSIFFFAITDINILFLECHSYRSGTVDSPYKTQYYYSCRRMTTHNGHSRSISFRFSCNFLDTLHSSTITVPSDLAIYNFAGTTNFPHPTTSLARTRRSHQQNNKATFIPTCVHILLRIPKHDINAC